MDEREYPIGTLVRLIWAKPDSWAKPGAIYTICTPAFRWKSGESAYGIRMRGGPNRNGWMYQGVEEQSTSLIQSCLPNRWLRPIDEDPDTELKFEEKVNDSSVPA